MPNERTASQIAIPHAADIVVAGAGIHGLSTAAHLAHQIRELGWKRSVLVVDKSRIGSGASGISGGIVRNFYLSEAMNEIVRQSVEIFELEPELFGFRQVGYIAAVPDRQAEDLRRIARQHAEVGYVSQLIDGQQESLAFLRRVFPDWVAEGTAAVLHEERGGWADARRTLEALAGIARSEGVRILEGVEVVGFDLHEGAVQSVETDAGSIRCDDVVVAPGPWARDFWRMLDLDEEVKTGEETDEPVFHYWAVQEGEFMHARSHLAANTPVVHLDVDSPLVSSVDGSTILEPPWGVYFRPSHGSAVACGGLPTPLAADVPLEPYGPSHENQGRADPAFVSSASKALSWALARFGDEPDAWTVSAFSAPTCFTPDSYPIVGHAHKNVYVVVDSNHGFKLLALGKLAASEILNGERCPELEPFRIDRFAQRTTHPTSASPYPWT